jgi:predicted dehydrogenase
LAESSPRLTTLERSLLLQQITDAIYASAAAGRAVEIE